MKKLLLPFFALIACTSVSHAQGFYFTGGLGYTVPSASQMNDNYGMPFNGTITPSAGVEHYSIKGASFSAGVNGQLGIGYMFNENIGMEVVSRQVLAPKKYTFTYYNFDYGGVTSDLSIVQQADLPTFLIPSVYMQTKGDPLAFYMKVGVVLPTWANITMDQIITNVPGTGAITTKDFTFSLTTSTSLGFAASAGLIYRASPKFDVFGELGFMSLTVLAKQQTLEALHVNGQAYSLANVTGATNITYSKTAVVDSSQAQLPAYSLPFSNFGLQIGVRYNLGDRGGSSKRKGKNDLHDRRKKF